MSETTDQPLSDDDISTESSMEVPPPSEQDADGVDLGKDADTEDHGGGHDTDGTDSDSSDSDSSDAS